MFKIIAIPHKELTDEILDVIIRIKSVAWPYSYDEQKEWIGINIKDTDIHILLNEGNQPVAYLNLIDIEIEIDNLTKKAFGVGNVCVSEKGKGYGQELMEQVNQYIVKNNKTGLLFCKNSLTHFYSKYGWELINKNILKLPFYIQNVESMFFNQTHNISSLKYNAHLF